MAERLPVLRELRDQKLAAEEAARTAREAELLKEEEEARRAAQAEADAKAEAEAANDNANIATESVDGVIREEEAEDQ